MEFFNGLNLVHPYLKFTMEIFNISIQFLMDLTISKVLSFLLAGLYRLVFTLNILIPSHTYMVADTFRGTS